MDHLNIAHAGKYIIIHGIRIGTVSGVVVGITTKKMVFSQVNKERLQFIRLCDFRCSEITDTMLVYKRRNMV